MSFIYCQTPVLSPKSRLPSLELEVDFVSPLLQQEDQEEQEEEPPPKSKLEFDTEDQVLLINYFQKYL